MYTERKDRGARVQVDLKEGTPVFGGGRGLSCLASRETVPQGPRHAVEAPPPEHGRRLGPPVPTGGNEEVTPSFRIVGVHAEPQSDGGGRTPLLRDPTGRCRPPPAVGPPRPPPAVATAQPDRGPLEGLSGPMPPRPRRGAPRVGEPSRLGLPTVLPESVRVSGLRV